jgi:hypothetical protein
MIALMTHAPFEMLWPTPSLDESCCTYLEVCPSQMDKQVYDEIRKSTCFFEIIRVGHSQDFRVDSSRAHDIASSDGRL